MRLRRGDGEVYLDRYGLECRLGGVFLHKMEAPDPGIHRHDHPWVFWSLVLKGGYTEERQDARTAPGPVPAVVVRRCWSVKAVRLDECHRIFKLHRVPTWTLVLRGPKRRDWGFYLPTGWMDWRTYDATVRAEARDLWVEISNDDRPKMRHAPGRGSNG